MSKSRSYSCIEAVGTYRSARNTFFDRQEMTVSSSEIGRLHRAGFSMTAQRTTHGRDRVSRSSLRNDRERCLEALKQLVNNRGADCFSDKATILLTRHWAETPWNGRAELLQAADWLIRVSAEFRQQQTKLCVPSERRS